MSNLLLTSPRPFHLLGSSKSVNCNNLPSLSSNRKRVSVIRACLFNPNQDPILKEALKEPVAFMGGIFAGLLRLDLNEEPLKDWVNRTVESSGITEEEIVAQEQKSEEEVPQQIDIE